MSTNNDRVVTTTPARKVETERVGGWRAAFLGSDEPNKQTGASWGAIFAGAAITIATLILFSLLGVAIGLGVLDLQSNNPLEGVGFGLGIWLVLTIIIAFGLGGYVAGALAVRGGFLHGLTTWATSTAVVFAAGVLGLSSLFGALGSAVGGVASAVGSAGGGIANVAGAGIDKATDAIADHFDVDFDKATDQAEKILADTGKPELQPGYLKAQLDASLEDAKQAAKDVAVKPGNYEQILNQLGDKLEARVDTIGQAIDKDAVAQSVARNTELTGEEAEKATQNAIDGYNKAVDQAKKAIEDAKNAIPEVEAQAKELFEQGKEVANDATSAVASAAVWTFVGLLASAVLTAFAGLAGSRAVISRRDSGALEAGATRTKVTN